jgi:beta-galactosidase GanA
MSELKRDMEILRNHGFNLIKLQEHWMVDEPLEGHYDFSRYEELIDYAARLDLGIYLGLTCEQAPGWLYRKHPGCRMVGRDGKTVVYEAQTTLPADGKPGPCYDHPGAAADQFRFLTRLVTDLGKYENIVVWNTWQEIGYWPQMMVGHPVCFCENTLAYFRNWLTEKYGDLDGLNRAWNTRYGDWSYVQPDRGSYQQNGLPHDVDWRYFMDNVQVANVLRQRAAAIKAADPFHRPVFAHKGGIAVAHGQDWTYARTQDFLGSSCYPAWNGFQTWDDGAPVRGFRPDKNQALVNEMAGGVALTYDQIRSCNPPGSPVWAAEFQGGPISTFLHKGRPIQPADLRRWMLTAVASGVTAISFWVTRAEIMAQETNGFSLLDSSGDTTARLEEAARVGAALNRHADLFGQPSWGGAEVAILNNETAAQLSSTVPPAHEHLTYSNKGWHRLLWDAGVPVDFVEISELDKRWVIYKLLVVPFPLSLSDADTTVLARYVENGGFLICEAAAGRLDEHNTARRGEIAPTLAQLAGCLHHSIQMVREPNAEQRWMPVERTWGEFLDAAVLEGQGKLSGVCTPANLYVQTFTPITGKSVLQTNGQTTGVMNTAGKGTILLLGTLVGHNAFAYRNPDTPRFIRRLLELGGVTPASTGGLLKRVRATPTKKALFFTNPGIEPLTETVEVQARQVEDLLGEPIALVNGRVTLTVQPYDVRVLILS